MTSSQCSKILLTHQIKFSPSVLQAVTYDKASVYFLRYTSQGFSTLLLSIYCCLFIYEAEFGVSSVAITGISCINETGKFETGFRQGNSRLFVEHLMSYLMAFKRSLTQFFNRYNINNGILFLTFLPSNNMQRFVSNTTIKIDMS